MRTQLHTTGNNFGAGEITFTAFEYSNLLILNAEVTFAPSNAAYQTASELEIYFEQLPFERSAVSGMLMFGTKNGEKNGTAIKSWIKDIHTIIVEKVTAWDDNDTVTLVFSNSYVPRNTKGPVTKLKWNFANPIDTAGGSVRIGQNYWTATDEWVFLGITFNAMEQSEEGTPVSFSLRDLPEIEDFDGIMLDNQAVSPSVGTKMFRFTIRDHVFSFESVYRSQYSRTIQYCGFLCYVPRKKAVSE